MSFTRYMLANWRIAFVPKIGVTYRYANEGPFAIGPALVPKKLLCGYVLYDAIHTNGVVTENACSYGVFASMCRASA